MSEADEMINKYNIGPDEAALVVTEQGESMIIIPETMTDTIVAHLLITIQNRMQDDPGFISDCAQWFHENLEDFPDEMRDMLAEAKENGDHVDVTSINLLKQ